jgi:hypothetical protein
MTDDVVFDDLRRLKPADWDLRCIDADEPDPMYAGDVFVAVHGDGNSNPSLRGASVGYRTPEGAALAQRWKQAYIAAGWPGGFHPDNYTAALQGYYGLINAVRDAGTEAAFILEVGMMTNPNDRAWIDGNHETIAATIWQAVAGTVAEGVNDMLQLLPPVPVGWKRIYRLRDGRGDYLLTASIDEANKAMTFGYIFEGPAFDLSYGNAVPIYRMVKNNFHHYAGIDEARQMETMGWVSEGPAFNAGVGGTTIHRAVKGDLHLFTASETEAHSAGWTYEGPAFSCGTAVVVSQPNDLATKQLAELKAKLHELSQ